MAPTMYSIETRAPLGSARRGREPDPTDASSGLDDDAAAAAARSRRDDSRDPLPSGAARFWLAVLLTGIGTGVAARQKLRDLRVPRAPWP
jgi:hypothetical protein